MQHGIMHATHDIYPASRTQTRDGLLSKGKKSEQTWVYLRVTSPKPMRRMRASSRVPASKAVRYSGVWTANSCSEVGSDGGCLT